MEYSVSLKEVPGGLSFPPHLSGRVSLDASTGRLAYRGFMTKCAYDELAKLSDEPEYRRALEQLFEGPAILRLIAQLGQLVVSTLGHEAAIGKAAGARVQGHSAAQVRRKGQPSRDLFQRNGILHVVLSHRKRRL